MDDEWFSAIHSLVPPSATMLAIARVFADGPLLVAVFVLAVMVAQPKRSFGISALKAGAAAAIGLLANFLIGYFWYRPRPFVAGIGQAWIAHAPTSSFPSDHLTAQWAIAGVLLLNRRTRMWGLGLALLGLPMAWARIYLGLHYPSDMFGGMVVAIVSVTMLSIVEARFMTGRE